MTRINVTRKQIENYYAAISDYFSSLNIKASKTTFSEKFKINGVQVPAICNRFWQILLIQLSRKLSEVVFYCFTSLDEFLDTSYDFFLHSILSDANWRIGMCEDFFELKLNIIYDQVSSHKLYNSNFIFTTSIIPVYKGEGEKIIGQISTYFYRISMWQTLRYSTPSPTLRVEILTVISDRVSCYEIGGVIAKVHNGT